MHILWMIVLVWKHAEAKCSLYRENGFIKLFVFCIMIKKKNSHIPDWCPTGHRQRKTKGLRSKQNNDNNNMTKEFTKVKILRTLWNYKNGDIDDNLITLYLREWKDREKKGFLVLTVFTTKNMSEFWRKHNLKQSD